METDLRLKMSGRPIKELTQEEKEEEIQRRAERSA